MIHVELLAMGDHHFNGLTVCLKPLTPYVITHSLVKEIRKLQNKVAENYYKQPWDDIYYIFWYLHEGKIPWKGLDFNFIHDCFKSNKESKFEEYIEHIFSLLFLNYVGLDLPLVNCSIVNRNTVGISSEIFFLNRINFIKCLHNQQVVELKNSVNEQITQINPMKKVKMTFPEEVYARNKFYKINCFKLSCMRDILLENGFTAFSPIEKNHIKCLFEQKKEETLNRFYALASKYHNVFERLAQVQANEHNLYLKRFCRKNIFR